jgi:hypothetical protein
VLSAPTPASLAAAAEAHAAALAAAVATAACPHCDYGAPSAAGSRPGSVAGWPGTHVGEIYGSAPLRSLLRVTSLLRSLSRNSAGQGPVQHATRPPGQVSSSILPAAPPPHPTRSARARATELPSPLVSGGALAALPPPGTCPVCRSRLRGSGPGSDTAWPGPRRRTPDSLWSCVAALERLDLRGLPFPAWWARSSALRPACVVLDEGQVYEEAGAAGHGGGLELPAALLRSLDAGRAQGAVVIDLTVRSLGLGPLRAV